MLTLNERNELIENYIPLANKLAWKKSRILPKFISFEEVQSAAFYGLVDAAQRCDRERIAAFGAFAAIRISGEINDYLRRQKNCASLEDASEESMANEAVDEYFDDITQCLNDLGKRIMVLYYKEQHTLKEIGSLIGVTESRVSQILTEDRKKIKRYWNEAA